MWFLIALVILAAFAVAILTLGTKIGLALVIFALAVAMIWRDNIGILQWVIFMIVFVWGIIRTRREGAHFFAGLAVLVITALLATNWTFWPDFSDGDKASSPNKVTRTVSPNTTDADGNTEDVPIVTPTNGTATPTDDTVTDESSTTDPQIGVTVECDRGGTIAEMVACVNSSPNKDEIVKFFNANETGILGDNAAGTTWDRLQAFPAKLDSRVILVLNAPDVTDAQARAAAAKTMGVKKANKAKIIRRDGVVLLNSYTDASGKVRTYGDQRKQIRTITTFATNGKDAMLRAYNGQGLGGGCINGFKGVLLKEKVKVVTRVETRTVTHTQNVNSTATVNAPGVTQTSSSTTTVPGPTETIIGPGATITVTTTATATASSESTVTTTVPGPGSTATVTETVPGPGGTSTVPGPTVTHTATSTVPGPGGTATVPGPTVTKTVTAPPPPPKTMTYTPPVETITRTHTAQPEPGPTVTVTVEVPASAHTGDPNPK